jgi:aldehyde reductase
MTTPSKKLLSNQEIPYIGLGTFRCNDPEELKQAVKEAINAGYRHFDCAYSYLNEDVVGKALQECYDESNGTLKREDLFITSKCWLTFLEKDRVQLCLDKTLQKSGFKYLDLVSKFKKKSFHLRFKYFNVFYFSI